MAYITLEEAKIQCRVDFTDDDTYITALIDTVEKVVENKIHDTLSNLEVESEIPLDIKQAMLFLISYYYNNREPIVIGTIVARLPDTAEDLLSVYINRTIA